MTVIEVVAILILVIVVMIIIINRFTSKSTNYHFSCLKGKVKSSTRHYITEVKSKGGGGYVSGEYGGYIAPPRIFSTIHSKQEVFLIDDHGKEHCVIIYNEEIPLIESYAISFYSVNNKNNYYCWAAYKNYSLETSNTFITKEELLDLKIINKPFKIVKKWLIIFLAGSFLIPQFRSSKNDFLLILSIICLLFVWAIFYYWIYCGIRDSLFSKKRISKINSELYAYMRTN